MAEQRFESSLLRQLSKWILVVVIEGHLDTANYPPDKRSDDGPAPALHDCKRSRKNRKTADALGGGESHDDLAEAWATVIPP
jgi:hypothetical protein